MRTIPLLLTFAAAAHSAQPSARRPEAAQIRPLPWGQLNFLHTTDTHGWHAGHIQEPSFSADWGDYISFAKHLRDRADEDGSDVLLIDTGDRVEGNGLYDASSPRGKYTFDIIKHQDIDVICSGNHELYKNTSSYTEYYETVPDFGGNYISSNIDIYDEDKGKFVPLAPRFRKFKTKNQGIRITAFGFLYDFNLNSNNTIVQPVEATIMEEWFQDAIHDREVDLFLIIGHVPVRSGDNDISEFNFIFEAIRKAHWDTPIQFFGGHTHIRDFVKFDKKSYALESGRYMETLGFLSIDGLRSEKTTAQSSLTVSRLYIDNNLYSMYQHSGKNDSTFPTELGRNVSKQITSARSALRLDRRHGCAPKDFWLYRTPVDSPDSIFRWLGEEVIPVQLSERNESTAPKLVISNTGAIRFDLFKGPFTVDSTYLISPFTSGFGVVRGVEYGIALKILNVLNNVDKVLTTQDSNLEKSHLHSSNLISPEQLALRRSHNSPLPKLPLTPQSQQDQSPLKHKHPITPGYTTTDDYGTEGDDTIHSPIQFYYLPNCVQTLVDWPEHEQPLPIETVDVVYNAFVEPWILYALLFLGSSQGRKDVEEYLPGTSLTSIIADWVEGNWPCEEEEMVEWDEL